VSCCLLLLSAVEPFHSTACEKTVNLARVAGWLAGGKVPEVVCLVEIKALINLREHSPRGTMVFFYCLSYLTTTAVMPLECGVGKKFKKK